MNIRFIPLLSLFMTVSLIVFMTLQLYWLREYYTMMNQDFSSKVYSVLEEATDKISRNEISRYYDRYQKLEHQVKAESKSPTQTYIQQSVQNGDLQTISYSKSIVEKQNIPVSTRGDSLERLKLYTDEGLYNIQLTPGIPKLLDPKLTHEIESGEYQIKEFARLNLSSIPTEKRYNLRMLDSVVSRDLALKGINMEYGLAVLDKMTHPTQIQNKIYRQNSQRPAYSYPLAQDKDGTTTHYLALVFPSKSFSLAEDNLPMLVGTIFSLLAILTIYIISINYMMRQKRISEIKTDFINNMSHEFKTPLATISVATESLGNDQVITYPEKVRYYASLIRQENIRMKKQVESVLAMSKLERNEMKMNLKITSLHKTLDEILNSFQLIVEQRGGVVIKEFLSQNDLVKIDDFHLGNAIINLLDNANKYSPDTPQIKVCTKNDTKWCYLEIQDQGMGMETESTRRIFEKFFRVETGNIHNVKGQGLGLSYVKKIVELHGGNIEVESTLGQGSTFRIRLPLK